MHKALDVIGLPVLEVETGKKLGAVKDFLIDREGGFCGLLLDARQWYSSPRWISRDEILAIGDDAVTVRYEDSAREWKKEEHGHPMSSGDGKIIGRPVLTFNGRRLGVIEDVYFGENMDKPLLGYELSDGFMTDLTEGRKWLPVNDSFTFGEEAVLVPAETERDLKEITQSMKE